VTWLAGRFGDTRCRAEHRPSSIPAVDASRIGSWWQRGALRLPALPERAAFSVGHVRQGGTRVGSVMQLLDAVAWVDMIALIDEGEVGDAALSHIGADGDGFGLSIAF
jgi:hypothetical protein